MGRHFTFLQYLSQCQVGCSADLHTFQASPICTAFYIMQAAAHELIASCYWSPEWAEFRMCSQEGENLDRELIHVIHLGPNEVTLEGLQLQCLDTEGRPMQIGRRGQMQTTWTNYV